MASRVMDLLVLRLFGNGLEAMALAWLVLVQALELTDGDICHLPMIAVRIALHRTLLFFVPVWDTPATLLLSLSMHTMLMYVLAFCSGALGAWVYPYRRFPYFIHLARGQGLIYA